MKGLRRHTATCLLLFLGLFYSVPYSLLHNCESLHHHHSETCIEAHHESCNLCELHLLPFIPTGEFGIELPETQNPAYHNTGLSGTTKAFSQETLNRGPPAGLPLA